jgi:hypothetical protein
LCWALAREGYLWRIGKPQEGPAFYKLDQNVAALESQ